MDITDLSKKTVEGSIHAFVIAFAERRTHIIRVIIPKGKTKFRGYRLGSHFDFTVWLTTVKCKRDESTAKQSIFVDIFFRGSIQLSFAAAPSQKKSKL